MEITASQFGPLIPTSLCLMATADAEPNQFPIIFIVHIFD
jgi:hypothetical protein